MLGDREYMRPGRPYGNYVSYWNQGLVVNKIIIANVVIFAIQFLTSSPFGGLTSVLWVSVPALKEPLGFLRIITYMFVHGGFWHLCINMWSLYIFGKPVEERTGPVVFLKLYFVSGIIGGLCWVLSNLNSTIPLVGASGAVFGVMAAAAMLFPKMQILLLFPPVVLRVKTLVICLAILEVIMLYRAHSQIAHLAHLGGLLGGFLFIGKYSSPLNRKPDKGSEIKYFKNTIGNVAKSFKSKFNSPQYRPPDLQFVSKSDDSASGAGEDAISSEIDPILDKIGKFGMKSLTSEEKRILERARDKLKDNF